MDDAGAGGEGLRTYTVRAQAVAKPTSYPRMISLSVAWVGHESLVVYGESSR